MNASHGTQSLGKSLRLVETVASGAHALDEITQVSGIPRSTAHRLLSALVQERYLTHHAGKGYGLGPMLIRLGFKARDELILTVVARPHMQNLSQRTLEAVHLGVLDDGAVMYVEKVPGKRGLSLTSYVGLRAPVQATALGKVLLADMEESLWPGYFDPNLAPTENSITDIDAFFEVLRATADRGYSEDIEENEAGVRCIAVPIRDGTGNVVASMSLSGATVYLTDEHVREILPLVQVAGNAISEELGWRTGAPSGPT